MFFVPLIKARRALHFAVYLEDLLGHILWRIQCRLTSVGALTLGESGTEADGGLMHQAPRLESDNRRAVRVFQSHLLSAACLPSSPTRGPSVQLHHSGTPRHVQPSFVQRSSCLGIQYRVEAGYRYLCAPT